MLRSSPNSLRYWCGWGLFNLYAYLDLRLLGASSTKKIGLKGGETCICSVLHLGLAIVPERQKVIISIIQMNTLRVRRFPMCIYTKWRLALRVWSIIGKGHAIIKEWIKKTTSWTCPVFTNLLHVVQKGHHGPCNRTRSIKIIVYSHFG